MRIKRVVGFGMLAVCSLSWAQPPKPVPSFEPPDAQRTRMELSQLLERYPPSVGTVLSVDPTLLANQPFLDTYPALVSFLSAHPEIGHNPSFYIETPALRFRGDPVAEDVMGDFMIIINLGMGLGLLGWLIRTLVDYRRWNRLTKTQTEVHTKLLDRFTANDDLLAYIQSPAGAKFLQSSPISARRRLREAWARRSAGFSGRCRAASC